MSEAQHKGRSKRRKKIIIAVVVLLLLVGMIGIWAMWGGSEKSSGSSTRYFAARRGDLTISITAKGQVTALDIVQVKSEVEGGTTIVSIVDDGTEISQEDVDANMILVELDSSRLTEQAATMEVAVAGARSGHTEALEAVGIQEMQNESDINASLLSLRFALMDFQRYLGEDIANEVIDSIDPNGAGRIDPNAVDSVDVEAIANDERLGGEALQRMRDLNSSIDLAQEQLRRARTKLDWTERLYEQEYVSLSEVEGDQFEVSRLQIDVDKALLARELFLQYEFVKQVQQLLSDYIEATRELARTEARARSRMAQAEARLLSATSTLRSQEERLVHTQEQIEKCTIRATAAGLVVYQMGGYRWDPVPVEVGMGVSERQHILSITDTGEMKVDIEVPESAIHRVHAGQRVRITLDAMADAEFGGEVLEVSRMPEPERWNSGDARLYSGEVSMLDADGNIKPGLSARVEIILDELEDVLYVPVQAVVNRGGRKICFVEEGGELVEREVETGEFNESFIEIVSGLSEGEQVCLTPPRLLDINEDGQAQAEGEDAGDEAESGDAGDQAAEIVDPCAAATAIEGELADPCAVMVESADPCSVREGIADPCAVVDDVSDPCVVMGDGSDVDGASAGQGED
ncbi:MAG: efflux RND transporter periplasmic adaptor subunit [Sedimentisphaerales bacterium]|nr:efflux RND transporter periplasmic adaptor subunit [Sedimentisphaerales bacterium]